MNSVIHLDKIRKSYFMGKMELECLKGIALDINRNEYVALMGPSGSGKSTLMNIIGCLDTPTSGKYILNGHDISQTIDNRLAEIRIKRSALYFNNSICYQD
jgi:putative ABC transport system ATP-binding protein